ncbi:MAG: hypothetical protein AMS21_03700 [Gemmatimonas sp. SG8_38_2]|nr:MAG: hypothetical protein AMS21_03700 [Gemmatimonas sp. SG8_38_2]
MSTESESEKLIAEIHREFREGLPARLETMRDSLQILSESYESEVAELFYRTAHSLKGTAPSFGADVLVPPSAALAEVGRRWFEDGRLSVEEVSAALVKLEQLSVAMAEYAAETEGGGAP